jgi:hypothetical protein
MIYGLQISLIGSNGDRIDLDDSGDFVLLSGARGFGMPSSIVRIDPSTGDGGIFRFSRREVRELDLPIAILGDSRSDVESKLRRVARLLQDKQGATRILATYLNGTTVFLDAHFLGGAETIFGEDAGLNYCRWVITMQAPEPFWQTATEESFTFGTGSTGRGLLPQLSKLRVSSSQTIGLVTVENAGDVATFPRWEITGPVDSIVITDGINSFSFPGSIAFGRTYTVDTRTAEVTNELGQNIYAELGPAPKLFPLPPGNTTIEVQGQNATVDTVVSAFYSPRFEVVH